MSNLLLDEYPLLVLPSLAISLGLNEAIFLQQLHYWLQKSDHSVEGHRWVYNSINEWQKQFPFWSRSTIKRIIYILEKDGYLLSGCFNSFKADKTKWYRIDYNRLNLANASVQNEPCLGSSCTKPHVKMSQPIPETTTDTTTETTTKEKTLLAHECAVREKNSISLHNTYTDDFEKAWSLYPKRLGGNNKRAAYKSWSVRVKEGVPPADMVNATKCYADICKAKGNVRTSYVMQAQRFYGVNRDYEEFLNVDPADFSRLVAEKSPPKKQYDSYEAKSPLDLYGFDASKYGV